MEVLVYFLGEGVIKSDIVELNSLLCKLLVIFKILFVLLQTVQNQQAVPVEGLLGPYLQLTLKIGDILHQQGVLNRKHNLLNDLNGIQVDLVVVDPQVVVD